MPDIDLAPLLLYRDCDLLILNKPAGIAVHQAPGAGATLDAGLDSLRFGLKWRPALAHRLDRDTSGCLVLGRHPQAVRTLMALFAEGAVEKTYWAVVHTPPADDAGRIDAPLLKVHRGRHWFMVADPAGQASVTEWRCRGRGTASSGAPIGWLELMPLTGRMHQIRVHCARLGSPVLGDAAYGAESRGLKLHLAAVGIRFAYGRRQIDVAAAPPATMHAALEACGWAPESPASALE